MSRITGNKTYLSIVLGVGYVFYCRYTGTPLDPAISATIGGLILAAFRSAQNTSTAQVVNAVVNPESAAAKVTAAEVPAAPAGDKLLDALTPDEQAQLFKLIQKAGGK